MRFSIHGLSWKQATKRGRCELSLRRNFSLRVTGLSLPLYLHVNFQAASNAWDADYCYRCTRCLSVNLFVTQGHSVQPSPNHFGLLLEVWREAASEACEAPSMWHDFWRHLWLCTVSYWLLVRLPSIAKSWSGAAVLLCSGIDRYSC